MTNSDYIRAHALCYAGVRIDVPPARSIARLYETQWLPWFERAMRTRLVVGALRYGDMHTPHEQDYVSWIERTIGAYIIDHNLEHMVDIANYAMLEAATAGGHYTPHDRDL